MSETKKLIETLKARAAYLVAGVMTSERDANDAMLMAQAVEALSQAQARCAEVEKDAARYRWLRGKVELGYDDAWSAALKLVLPVFHEKSIGTFVNGSICGHLDAAIDDALKEPR